MAAIRAYFFLSNLPEMVSELTGPVSEGFRRWKTSRYEPGHSGTTNCRSHPPKNLVFLLVDALKLAPR